MSEAIEITGRLLESDRNLIGDDEFRVMFVVDKACVPLATALFNRRKQLLTVTVKNEQHLPVAIRFRCVIPEGKTHLGGRKTFRVTFDLPATDAAQGAKFFAMPEGLLYALTVEQGDTTGEPLPEPKKKEAKAAKPKGPYGAFWEVICKRAIFNTPALDAWVKANSINATQTAEHVIRDVFQVDSRTFISPGTLLAQLKKDLEPQTYANIEVTLNRIREQVGGED